MRKLNVIYLGSHPTERLVRDSKGKIVCLYKVAEAVIEGFRKNDGISLKVITSPDMASFPENKLFYKSQYDDEEDTFVVSSLNLPIVKQLWTIVSMSTCVLKEVYKTNGHTTVVIPYMVFRHVIAAWIIRFFSFGKVDISIIVPDVFFPENIVLKAVNKITESLAKSFDSFVLYTEKMADYLSIKNKKYIVIEGFYQITNHSVSKSDNKFIITYTGSLNARYGILRLLDAFDLVTIKNAELHLYGGGDAEIEIMNKSKANEKIKFFGMVSKDIATKAIYESSLLINPRNATDGDYVQYSFPSKDIDYLSSGIPCVLCKLPGMPCEYYGHFIDAGDGSPEEIANAINQAYNMDRSKLEGMAQNAKLFMIDRMNNEKQVARIIKMIE